MNDKDIRLENLTPEQVEMLDIMWAFEDYEDILAWQQSLDKDDREMSEALFQMILLEIVDQNVNSLLTENLAEARECLKKFML